jgi:DNA (cytosine-5)-methyltransferase 1
VKPRLLDLFCGAGGAAMGYSRAGFEVMGVDIASQPRYPFEFVQADALTWLQDQGVEGFAAIHASPPCEGYSSLRFFHPGRIWPDLILETRKLLLESGLPYVIENVPGSPLLNPTVLCGSSVGLPIWRHRLFETSWPLMVPPCCHGLVPRPLAIATKRQAGVQARFRNPTDADQQREAMEIPWATRFEVGKAIPPVYTELIGHQLMQHINTRHREAAAS